MAKLNIASFNCKGFKFRNYDFISTVFKDCSFLILQEHWLFSCEFKMFSNVLTNCGYHALSSMGDGEFIRGRPYGGTAVIWNNSINAKVTPLTTSTPRICAVLVTSDIYRLLMISVYMPVNHADNMEEFINVLSEISALHLEHGDYDMICAGDYNCDLANEDDRGAVLLSWVRDLDLMCPALAPNAPRRVTYCAPDGRTALLDYVFMSQNIYQSVASWNVIDSGANLSDHSPKVITYDKIPEYIPLNNPFTRKPLWHKASDEMKRNYREKLDSYLSEINLDSAVIQCKNYDKCDTHLGHFQCLLSSIMNACKRATRECIPHSKPQNSKVAGWNDIARGKRDDSMFWHERWKEAGRPRDGWIAEMRRRTRAKYHAAVKYVKRNRDTIIKQKTAYSLQDTNPLKFWTNISKLKRSKNLASSIIDGFKGQDACKAFYNKYNKLYNNNPSQKLNDIRIAINDGIQNCCTAVECNNIKDKHLHTITNSMIKSAINKLKYGQYCSNAEIMSDSILYGTDRLYTLIAIMFTIMLRHGYDCDIFNNVTIIPIPKDKRKSLADSDNYRGISPNSALPKIFDYLIIDHFPNVFLTCDQQCAYKDQFSTTLCTFMVLETIQYYRDRGSCVYATLLDCSKAFDYVKFDALFTKLLDRKLCPLISRVLLNVYTNSKYRVQWNGNKSEYFNISNGVKQGAVLSALLYTIYVEELIDNIHNTKLGCHIGNKCASVFIYADDIIILSPTRQAMQSLLDICATFANSYGLLYNYTKCKVMLFCNIHFDNTPILYLNNIPLTTVNHEKHLGHMLMDKGDTINFEAVVNDIRAKTNCIKRNFTCLSYECKAKLFASQCNSFYGCELIDLSSTQFDNLVVNWRKSIRYLLDIPFRTHNCLLPYIINTPSANSQIYSRIICFMKNGLQHNSEYISFFFRHCIRNFNSYMSKNVNIICRKLNIRAEDITHKSKRWIKQSVKLIDPSPDWRRSVINELLRCRDGELDNSLSKEEIDAMLEYVCTS